MAIRMVAVALLALLLCGCASGPTLTERQAKIAAQQATNLVCVNAFYHSTLTKHRDRYCWSMEISGYNERGFYRHYSVSLDASTGAPMDVKEAPLKVPLSPTKYVDIKELCLRNKGITLRLLGSSAELCVSGKRYTVVAGGSAAMLGRQAIPLSGSAEFVEGKLMVPGDLLQTLARHKTNQAVP